MIEFCFAWSYDIIEHPWPVFLKYLFFGVILFLVGLLPWVDNYANMMGFFFGLLLSLILFPAANISIKDISKTRKEAKKSSQQQGIQKTVAHQEVPEREKKKEGKEKAKEKEEKAREREKTEAEKAREREKTEEEKELEREKAEEEEDARVNRRMYCVRLATILVCFFICVALFVLLFVWFYIFPLTECSFCSYINCIPIPFIPGFCDNMQIHIDESSPSCYAPQH